MQVLAIIPARGGSKRLPGKNIKPIAGLPLIAHTIRAAIDAPSVGRVVVSTDCPEILETARTSALANRGDLADMGCGIALRPGELLPRDTPAGWQCRTVDPHPNVHGDICPFGLRPAALATDTATSEDVVVHALDWLRDHEGYEPDLFVLLQTTSPLRTAVDIERALRRRGVIPAGNVPGELLIRGQTLEWTYMDEPRPVVSVNAATGVRNGAIYIASPNWIRTIGGWEPATPYPMLDRYSVDIDTAEDFTHAEWLMGYGR